MAQTEKKVKISSCPECEAPLFLNEETGEVECDYCDFKIHKKSIEKFKVIEPTDEYNKQILSYVIYTSQ